MFEHGLLMLLAAAALVFVSAIWSRLTGPATAALIQAACARSSHDGTKQPLECGDAMLELSHEALLCGVGVVILLVVWLPLLLSKLPLSLSIISLIAGMALSFSFECPKGNTPLRKSRVVVPQI